MLKLSKIDPSQTNHNSLSDAQKSNTSDAPQPYTLPDVPQPQPNFFQDFLSREGLARQLNTTTRTLDRWEALRIGPPRIVVQGFVYYRVAAVRSWLEKHEGLPRKTRKPYTRRKKPEPTHQVEIVKEAAE